MDWTRDLPDGSSLTRQSAQRQDDAKAELEDIAAQIESEVALLKLADPGSPTLIQDKESKGSLYVLMPMRV